MPFKIQIKHWTLTVPRDKEFGNEDTVSEVLTPYVPFKCIENDCEVNGIQWTDSPRFKIRDQYRDVKLIIDGNLYGSSPNDFKAEAKEIVNVMKWIKPKDGKKTDVIGKKFELKWPAQLFAAFAYMKITYVSQETNYITNVVRGKNAPSGILDGTFKYHNKDSENTLPYMIRDGMYLNENFHIKESWGSTNQQLNKELNIHQVSDVDLLWKNDQVFWQQNHQDVEFSIWRAMKIDGYFNPGDIITSGHSSPGVGFLLRSNPKSTLDHFKLPDSYDIVFVSEDIAFIDSSCCIWKLNCPPSYVALGFVAKENCTEPEMGDAYCVHHSLTSTIENWDEKFFGGNTNLINTGSLNQAKVNDNQFDMLQMGAYMNWDNKNTKHMSIKVFRNNPPVTYAVNRASGNFWTEKPILYTTIDDVTYDFNNMEVKANPTELNSAFLENYSHIPQTVTRTLSYTEESAFEFDMGENVEVGLNVEVAVEITIPKIEIKIGVDTAVSTSYHDGWENGKASVTSETKSITAAMEIPDSHKLEVIVVANKYETNVPYSATLTKKYYDGSFEKMKISGMFKGSV